jgi:hypothetical protein
MLCILLKRFSSSVPNVVVKDTHQVSFPDVLYIPCNSAINASSVTQPLAPGTRKTYEVCGVVKHEGSTIARGHYYSFIRAPAASGAGSLAVGPQAGPAGAVSVTAPAEDWYKMNDSAVSVVSFDYWHSCLTRSYPCCAYVYAGISSERPQFRGLPIILPA